MKKKRKKKKEEIRKKSEERRTKKREIRRKKKRKKKQIIWKSWGGHQSSVVADAIPPVVRSLGGVLREGMGAVLRALAALSQSPARTAW